MALNWERKQDVIVDALAEKLDARLREWKPETVAEARGRIAEVIELADHDILDIARSRAAEQDVLDLLDEPPTR
jgi:exonuclease V gamma subunit